MKCAVDQCDFHIQQRITRQRTFFHAYAEAFFDRWPEFPRYVTAGNDRFELESGTSFGRFDDVVDLGELASTSGLLLVSITVFNPLSNGLSISHLRCTYVYFNPMGTLKDVDFYVEVQFTHTFNDGFARLFVRLYAERGILLDHLAQRYSELLGGTFVFRVDCYRYHRVREHHGFQRGRLVGIAQCVTGSCVFHADQGNNVAGLG